MPVQHAVEEEYQQFKGWKPSYRACCFRKQSKKASVRDVSRAA